MTKLNSDILFRIFIGICLLASAVLFAAAAWTAFAPTEEDEAVDEELMLVGSWPYVDGTLISAEYVGEDFEIVVRNEVTTEEEAWIVCDSDLIQAIAQFPLGSKVEGWAGYNNERKMHVVTELAVVD